MTPKRLRWFVVGCNYEHSSRHLFPTSEPLKTQWVTFVSEGNEPPIYLNAFMFTQIICDPASPTEEVSVRFFFFMNLWNSPFLITCYLASFTMNAAKDYRLSEISSEERGGVNRAHLHLMQNAPIRLALKRAVFDRVKRVLFYTTNETFWKLVENDPLKTKFH